MKKIILSFMFLSSFAFANFASNPGAVSVGQVIFLGNHYRIVTDSAFVAQDVFAGANLSVQEDFWEYNPGDFSVHHIMFHKTPELHYYKTEKAYYTNWYAWADGQCPSGTTLNSNGVCSSPDLPPPTCPEGAHADGQNCVGDFPLKASTPLESGGNFSLFEDGATMYCRPNGECETTNDKGERIPNRFVNGAIPSEISDLKDFGFYLLSKVGNAVGKTLQWGGMTMLLNGTGGGALIYEGGNPALNGLNPVFVASAGLIALGNALVTEENVVLYTPKVDGVLNVDIVEKTPQTSTANLDAQTPSDGSPALSENGAYTQQKITAENAQTIWDKSAGVGKLPPNALVLGSDIIYPTKNPDKAIVNTSDALLMVETKPDGSSTIIEVSKNDIATSSSNNTDLNYIKKDISPTKINNDGTTTTTTNTSVGSVSSTTNTNTTTSPTGTTTTTDPLSGTSPNGVITPSSDGTGSNINLSGVTSRLDKISNQLTKVNDFNEKLEKLNVPNVEHGIPSMPDSWSSFTTTWDGIKSDMQNVVTQVDDFKSYINGNPLTLNLNGGSLSTCPYTKNLDLGFGKNMDISFDACKVISPAYNVVYLLTYIPMVLTILFFAIKIFFLMVV